jgi:DNA-binding transcriptional LysR family regulator
MDLNRIATFVKVATAGSFTGAANALGIPKSSVSRSVGALEAELGVRLLHRTTRKLHLTDAGKQYLERAKAAVLELQEATAAVGELGEEPRGTVRISAPFDMVEFLAEALNQFGKKYPHVHVDLSLSGRQVDLIAEGFDFALRAGALADSTLIARKIGDAQLALFAAASYLRRRGRPRQLQDLAAHDCVLYRSPLGRATWRLQGPRGEESVDVTARVSCDEMWFVRRATAAGIGIGLLPSSAGGAPRTADNLVRVLPSYAVTGGGLHLVYPSSRFLPTRVSLLRDFLSEHMKAALLGTDRR